MTAPTPTAGRPENRAETERWEAGKAATRRAFEGIEAATILKPGDRVLLTVDDRWSLQEMEEARQKLDERFPDVEFTFVNGVESVTIVSEVDRG